MKLTGYIDNRGICLSNKIFGKISFQEEPITLELMFLNSMPFKFNEFKKLVRSCKDEGIVLDVAGHKIKVNKKYLGKFLNEYTNKTAKEVNLKFIGGGSPILFEINDDWIVLSPIVRLEND